MRQRHTSRSVGKPSSTPAADFSHTHACTHNATESSALCFVGRHLVARATDRHALVGRRQSSVLLLVVLPVASSFGIRTRPFPTRAHVVMGWTSPLELGFNGGHDEACGCVRALDARVRHLFATDGERPNGDRAQNSASRLSAREQETSATTSLARGRLGRA